MIILIVILGLVYVVHPFPRFEKMLVKLLIKAKHPTGKILAFTLQYSDWSSSIRDIGDSDSFYHRPTLAVATVQVGSIKRDIELKRILLFWFFRSDYSQNGIEVSGTEYYAEISSHNIGRRADIEKWCRANWTVPCSDGALYRRLGTGRNGTGEYYGVKVCKRLFMVENGVVKQFGQRASDWTESDITYSELKKYSNYKQLKKETFEEILRYRP